MSGHSKRKARVFVREKKSAATVNAKNYPIS